MSLGVGGCGGLGGGMGEGKIAVGNYHSRVMRDLEIQPFPGCGKLSMSSPDEGLGVVEQNE